MRRFLSLTLFVLWITLFCGYAQRPTQKHTPWDVRLTGTFGQALIPSSSNYQISSQPGFNYGGGIEVDYLVKERWGVGIGVVYQSLSSYLALSGYSATVFGTDSWNGDPTQRNYEFYINTNNTDVVDLIEITSVDIPIYAYYKYPIKKNTFIDFRGGLQLSFPRESTSQLHTSDLFTRLYFEEWDLLLFEIPAHGLYDSRTDWHPTQTIETPVLASMLLSVGMDFPFLRVLQMRASGYLTYSLNQVNHQKEDALIYWRNDYNGVMSLTNTNHLLSYGIKIAIGINKYPNPPPMRSAEYNCAGCTWIKREETYRSKRK